MASVGALFASSHPSQDRLDRGKAWILRGAHYGEQLEPKLVIGPLYEVANGAGSEISDSHCRRCGAALDLSSEDGVECREHHGSNIWTVEGSDKITKHSPTLL